jgi:hypothetical protein
MTGPRRVRLLLAVAIFAAAGFLLRGYTTDDTYIHLRYAQNLLDSGEFAFNPGRATYGATSPLWVLGLALLLKLGAPPLAAAWLLGAACGLMVLLLAESIISRFTYQEHWKTLFVVALALDPWFLRWSYSGMETPLATLLLLTLIWPIVSGRDLGWGVSREALWQRYLGWGVAAGMAGLVRPEFLVLGPLALPILLWFEYYRAGAVHGAAGRVRARPHKPLLASVTGWALVVGPWLLYARWAFGRLMPETVAAKGGGLVLAPPSLLQNVVAAAKPLASTQGFYWAGLFVLAGLVLARNHRFRFYDEEQFEGAAAAAASERNESWSVWGPVALVGVAVVWTAVLLGGYAVRQVWVISRYVSPLTPVMLMAMSLIAEWLLRGQAIDRTVLRAGRVVIASFAGLALAFNVWLFVTGVLPHARKFPQGLQECYVGAGDWLRDNTEPDAVVAALDIGALGFASERTILDLMGLVSPEILELGARLGFAEMVASGAWLTAGPGGGPPDYFVDRTDGPPRWANRTVDGVTFELLRTCTIDGVGIRESQPWTVALYRLSPTARRVRSSAGG